MNSSLTISTILLILNILAQASSRPQVEEEASTQVKDRPSAVTHQKGTHPSMTRDPLRWIWIDETSLELTWSSKFSLSLNDAVGGYGLSLSLPQHNEPFAATTIYSSTNLQHQFGGLKSNVTYGGNLEALVGPHHWPYNLLNFTFSSAVLMHGGGLGQRSIAERPNSSTADLGSVAVGVTLRWSHSPFTTGSLTSSEWDSDGGRPEGLKPDGYLLQIWDHKHLLLKITTTVTGKHDGCIATIGGLSLDTTYKATLEGLHSDGRIGTTLSFSLDAGGFYVAGGALTTDGVSECYSGLQVRCPASERCVSPYWICDGAPDCPDGEDEIGCDKSPCDGFRCWDNVCIPGAWRCDGHRDCKDGDDEYACSGCGEGAIGCSTVGFCFYPNATCDGIPDCPDGWDESLAVCGGKECSAGELPCWDNDHCVQHSRLCDGTPDCPTAEDEDRSFCVAFKSMQETTTLAVDLQASLCEERIYMKQTNCSLDDYQCESGECIPRMYLCNGHFDCHTGDDEEPNACSFNNNIHPIISQKPKNVSDVDESGLASCEENMLRCPSGKCIRSDRCLSNDLCDDEHLEEACAHASDSDINNEIETNIIDGSNSVELDILPALSSETDWEIGEETLMDQDNLIIAHSKMAESDNTTGSANTGSNLTAAPVLQGFDLESLEDISQTPYVNPSQENTLSQKETNPDGVDVSVEVVIIEDPAESAEGEVEMTTISGGDENLIDDSELPGRNELLIPLGVDTSSNASNITGNESDVRELFTDDSKNNTTLHMLISDIFETFNVSIEENEIDRVIINSTKLLNLDSDEESDTDIIPLDIPLDVSFNSSEAKHIGKSNASSNPAEIEKDFTENNLTDETGQASQNGFNVSIEDVILNGQNESGNLTTELPVYDDYTFDDPMHVEDSINITTDTIETVVDSSSSPTVGDHSSTLFDENDLLSGNLTTEKPEEVDLSKGSNITEIPSPDSDQSLEAETSEAPTTTTDSVVSLQPSTTEEASNLEEVSDVQMTTEKDQHQSTTELVMTEAPTISNNIPVAITTEPDNWKEMPDGRKNLTILIAVHSIGNESKIPQYIIHGVDGSTYEYEVVGVNDDDNQEDNSIANNELTGGVHELSYLYDTGSSAAKSSFAIILLIPLIVDVFVNI